MDPLVAFIALLWLALPTGVLLVVLVRARSALERVLAFDTLMLVLTAAVVLVAYLRRSPLYLDAALVLALASFIGTVAAARFAGSGNGRS